MATPVILLIHGRGVKAGKDAELAHWRRGLAAGQDAAGIDPLLPPLDQIDIRMAYYSDQLYPELQPQPQALSERQILERLVMGKVVHALLERYYAYEAELRRAHGDGFQPEAVVPLDPVRLRPGQSYDPFVLDLIKYFALGYRDSINQRLIDQLEAIRREVPNPAILLLSHSYGTIVSYDVLTTHPDYRVDTWVTMGCPLGYAEETQARLLEWVGELTPDIWAEIGQGLEGAQQAFEDAKRKAGEILEGARKGIRDFFGRLRGEMHAESLLVPQHVYRLAPRQYPAPQVSRWYNLYDVQDPVANPPFVGDPTLAEEFLSHGRPRVYDIAIQNPLRPDAHHEIGYLGTTYAGWLVKDFLLRHR